MRSELPYRGLTSPVLRAPLRPILDGSRFRFRTRAEWEGAVRVLWDEATHREEWYAALALTKHRHYRHWLDSDLMRLLRHLIETGAWWSVDEHLWVRRTAIIAQVGAGEHTDPALLADVIEPNLADRDFFIRKAIGWALRDAARTHPGWVRAFVGRHEGGLSALSRREALKHLG